MKRITSLIIAAAALSSATATSQTLNREITVEREITAVERGATKIPLLPTVTLTPVERLRLSTSEKGVPTRVAPGLTLLDPVAWRDSLDGSDQRGYLIGAVGGPLINGEFAAGYRLIDRAATRLGLFVDYTTENYKADNLYRRSHDAGLGVELSQRLGRTRLSALADYRFTRFNIHDFELWDTPHQRYWDNVNRLGVSASLRPERRGYVDYGADAAWEYFGNSTAPYGYTPVKQHYGSVGGFGSVAMADALTLRLDAGVDLLATSACFGSTPLGGYTVEEARTRGVATILPRVGYAGRRLSLLAGPRIDFRINDGKSLHVAPDVTLGWTPSPWLAFEASAGGRQTLNRLSVLSDECLRLMPFVAYGLSDLALTADARLTVGPWRGMWLELFGGWAKADDWLMPSLRQGDVWAAQFECADVKGFHGGAAVNFEWGRLGRLRVSYETAPSAVGKGYYAWRDRARHVVGATLTVRPFDRLRIDLGFDLRTGRQIISSREEPIFVMGVQTGSTPTYEYQPLNDIADLRARLTWSVDRRLDLFVDGSNLLNHRSLGIDLAPQRGIAAVVGASLRFF